MHLAFYNVVMGSCPIFVTCSSCHLQVLLVYQFIYMIMDNREFTHLTLLIISQMSSVERVRAFNHVVVGLISIFGETLFGMMLSYNYFPYFYFINLMTHHLIFNSQLAFHLMPQLTIITNCHLPHYSPILDVGNIYWIFVLTKDFPFVKYQLQLKYSTVLTDCFCLQTYSMMSFSSKNIKELYIWW